MQRFVLFSLIMFFFHLSDIKAQVKIDFSEIEKKIYSCKIKREWKIKYKNDTLTKIIFFTKKPFKKYVFYVLFNPFGIPSNFHDVIWITMTERSLLHNKEISNFRYFVFDNRIVESTFDYYDSYTSYLYGNSDYPQTNINFNIHSFYLNYTIGNISHIEESLFGILYDDIKRRDLPIQYPDLDICSYIYLYGLYNTYKSDNNFVDFLSRYLIIH